MRLRGVNSPGALSTLPIVGVAWPVQRKPTNPPSA
jgi:hypothetical protein